MKGRHVGYVRVSTHDQNTVRQLADCKIDFWKIYEEKASGKNTDRPELQDCLSRLDEGDTLWIHSIDRLARSLQDLQNIISQLSPLFFFSSSRPRHNCFGSSQNSPSLGFSHSIIRPDIPTPSTRIPPSRVAL